MAYGKIFNKNTNIECKIYFKCKGSNVVHRIGGPAKEYKNGDKEWYVNGKLHRVDGPAIEWVGGTKEWYKHNMRHREDGPAIENTNGFARYYLNGVFYTKEEYIKEISIRKFGGFV